MLGYGSACAGDLGQGCRLSSGRISVIQPAPASYLLRGRSWASTGLQGPLAALRGAHSYWKAALRTEIASVRTVVGAATPQYPQLLSSGNQFLRNGPLPLQAASPASDGLNFTDGIHRPSQGTASGPPSHLPLPFPAGNQLLSQIGHFLVLLSTLNTQLSNEIYSCFSCLMFWVMEQLPLHCNAFISGMLQCLVGG